MNFKKRAIEIHGFLLIFVYIKTYSMSIILAIISITMWIAYELWRAPLYNEETMKIIKPGKTIKNLFKKKL